MLIMKFGDAVFKPQDTDDDGKLLYESWCQKQFELEEEDDDED
jgi:hypothetical protein